MAEKKRIKKVSEFDDALCWACLLLLAIILVFNPFYPFSSSNVTTIIVALVFLLILWNVFSERFTKVKLLLSVLLLFVLIWDFITGHVTSTITTIVEVKSSYALLPFILLRVPLVLLDLIFLPTLPKYFMGVIILATFWGFLGILFHSKGLKKISGGIQQKAAKNSILEEVRDILFSENKACLLIAAISFITYLFIVSLYYPMPIGGDIWGNFQVLLGYYGYTSFEGSIIVYHSLPWNSAPLYAIKYRPIYYFFLYNLGRLWQITNNYVVFIEIIPAFFNALLSILIYVLSLKITNNNKTSLIAGLISGLSVGQLLMLRINIQETLGLILMLCTLYSYLSLTCDGENRSIDKFIIFFVMLNLVQFTHEQPFVVFLTIILVHQTFHFLSQEMKKPTNVSKKSLLVYTRNCFRNHLKGLYVIFTIIVSFIIRYIYAFFVRKGDLALLISSAPSSKGSYLPYCTLANMYSIPIMIFSFFGIILGFKSLRRENKVFLTALLFATLIYIFQAPLGIVINPQAARIPNELYFPFIILASLGINKLFSQSMRISVSVKLNFKKLRHKCITFNLKYLVFFLIIFSSSFTYIMCSDQIPREYIIFPTETLYSQPEYEAALWLKSHINPNRTIVIADTEYFAAIHCLSEFKVIRFNDYFIGPFTGYGENPIVTLNRLVEYWLSKNYKIIICQRNQDALKDFILPFPQIFGNEYVKLYLVEPSYESFNIVNYNKNYTIFNFDAGIRNDTTRVNNATLIYDPELNRWVWHFDGINDFSEISSSANLENLSEITIEALFKTSVSSESYIFQKLIGGWGWNTGYGLYIRNGILQAVFGKGGEDTNCYVIYSGVNVTDGEWHHVVATAKPNGYAKLYVDGKMPAHSEAVQETATLSLSNTKVLRIGEGFGHYFNGSVAFVRVYNKALNEKEVAELYWSTKNVIHVIHVIHDGSFEDLPLSFEGFGPLTANASIKLKGYTYYKLSNIPGFLFFKGISPNPASIEINESEILIMAGDKKEEYTVTFEAIMSYSNVGWKDETFSGGWSMWENQNGGIYMINGNIITIGKHFDLGSIDKFALKKRVTIDGVHYPYLIVKALGERSLEVKSLERISPCLSVMLHSVDGEWINVLGVQPTSNWDLYIIKIPPLIYDEIVIQINDEPYDIAGYHEIRIDYIFFADWTPCQFWPSYYVKP